MEKVIIQHMLWGERGYQECWELRFGHVQHHIQKPNWGEFKKGLEKKNYSSNYSLLF